jgi:hypothetical protein
MAIAYSCLYGIYEVSYKYKGKTNIVKLSKNKFWEFIDWLKKNAEFQYYIHSNLNPQIYHGENWIL